MRLFFIHQKNDHQSFDYLRAIIQLEYIVLGLRTALRSIKHHCVLCRKRKAEVITPRMAGLITTFCLVEQPLNNRPLTPVSSDLNNLEAKINHRKRYFRAQFYANAIWTRWLPEYVPMLNTRAKWFSSPESHLKTGDLAWLIEDNRPRGHYPLARSNH